MNTSDKKVTALVLNMYTTTLVPYKTLKNKQQPQPNKKTQHTTQTPFLKNPQTNKQTTKSQPCCTTPPKRNNTNMFLNMHSYSLPHSGGRTHNAAAYKSRAEPSENYFFTVRFPDSSAPLSNWLHIWISTRAYTKDAAKMHGFHQQHTIKSSYCNVKNIIITLESIAAP